MIGQNDLLEESKLSSHLTTSEQEVKVPFNTGDSFSDARGGHSQGRCAVKSLPREKHLDKECLLVVATALRGYKRRRFLSRNERESVEAPRLLSGITTMACVDSGQNPPSTCFIFRMAAGFTVRHQVRVHKLCTGEFTIWLYFVWRLTEAVLWKAAF